MKAEQAQALVLVAGIAIAATIFAVHCILSRKRGASPASTPKRARHAAPKVRRANPYSLQEGELAIAFRVGGRYYNSVKNRVFECIGTRGKRARQVYWSCLDDVESSRALMREPELGGFVKVRIDDGVETCERGAFRADRPATEKEIADEREFLRDLRRKTKMGL